MKTQSHILPLAISQFRKDWPFMVQRAYAVRVEAGTRGPACGDTSPAEGVYPSSNPDGNYGDNQAQTTTGGLS